MGQYWGEVLCPLYGGARSPSNTMTPGSKSTSVPSGILIHPAAWPQQTWADNWGLCPFWGGRAGSPSNRMWPGPRHTWLPSFILIHPTVWPKYTNVADRTGQTERQRSDSIQRTVLETVAQRTTTSLMILYAGQPGWIFARKKHSVTLAAHTSTTFKMSNI